MRSPFLSFRVLVTAFEPFGGRPENASRAILQSLLTLDRAPGEEFEGLVLPVVYDRSAELLLEKLRSEKWDLILALGEAPESPFRIETQAWNRDDSETPDLAGVVRKEREIIPGGPKQIPTRLPANSLFSKLQAADFPVVLSNSAGGYICNHVFYYLMHELETAPALKKAQGGFLHVPIDWCTRALEGARIVQSVIRTTAFGRLL
jgi:pyroglutamyl-peptidase